MWAQSTPKPPPSQLSVTIDLNNHILPHHFHSPCVGCGWGKEDWGGCIWCILLVTHNINTPTALVKHNFSTRSSRFMQKVSLESLFQELSNKTKKKQNERVTCSKITAQRKASASQVCLTCTLLFDTKLWLVQNQESKVWKVIHSPLELNVQKQQVAGVNFECVKSYALVWTRAYTRGCKGVQSKQAW
jgi:hypothetical protein